MNMGLIPAQKLLAWLDASTSVAQRQNRMRWYAAYVQGVDFATMMRWSRRPRLSDVISSNDYDNQNQA